MTKLWFEIDENYKTKDISNGTQPNVFRVRFIQSAVLHIHESRGAPLGLFENTYLQLGLLNCSA